MIFYCHLVLQKKKINKAIDEAELTLSSLTDTSGYENINMFKHWKTPYSITKETYYFTKKYIMENGKKMLKLMVMK